jgi:hypothetical protein
MWWRVIVLLNMIKVHFMCVWKCPNENSFFVQLICLNKINLVLVYKVKWSSDTSMCHEILQSSYINISSSSHNYHSVGMLRAPEISLSKLPICHTVLILVIMLYMRSLHYSSNTTAIWTLWPTSHHFSNHNPTLLLCIQLFQKPYKVRSWSMSSFLIGLFHLAYAIQYHPCCCKCQDLRV